MTKTAGNPFPFPMPNADAMIAAQQRNIDAWASAGQIMVDGAKALVQRQSEIMQASVDQWVSAGQNAMAFKTTEYKPADQVAKAKSAYESAIGHTKELTEIAMKAQGEAVAVLTQCVMANIDEMKTLNSKAA